MHSPHAKIPTEQDAGAIVETVLHEEPRSVTRFLTGLAHYVYEVITANDRTVVVRIARHGGESLTGAVYWSNRLRPLGVPLPRILHAEPQAIPYPFLILERLPGTDLNHVYPHLSVEQKRSIAADVVRAQTLTSTLPEGNGFGYAGSYETPFPFRTWIEVLEASLQRSRSRMSQAGVFALSHVERIETQLARHEKLLSRVRPIAFLDDTTTKNVIVHEGRLSGIVDVDVVCFGDPLWTVGLTQMALLKSGHELDYVGFWSGLLALTGEQQQLLQLYTAIFCVDFMSELGQTFNRAQPAPINPQDVERLLEIYDRLTGSLTAFA